MPLVRNQFVPQFLLQIFTSAAAMTDLRTGQPYLAGGLVKGDYFDLTEAEAQQQAVSLHSGRYRFVQLDPQATAANVLTGRIGAMRSVAQGVNFITDYSHNLGGAPELPRGVVFISNPTPAQILAGCWIFVQELGDATVMVSRAVDVGESLIVVAGGKVGSFDDVGTGEDSSGRFVGRALQATTATDQLARAILGFAVVQD